MLAELDLPRTLALRVLGNGVVPQQAVAALRAAAVPAPVDGAGMTEPTSLDRYLYHRIGAVELYLGDARQVLAAVPDGNVDCIVTRPPFWSLRDYGTGGDATATLRAHIGQRNGARTARRVAGAAPCGAIFSTGSSRPSTSTWTGSWPCSTRRGGFFHRPARCGSISGTATPAAPEALPAPVRADR
ncbi:hypothetical protein [Polymorphospora rubra]|uniref:hypothetical protein n=1 Tax=Polymorphospora rubra TaxID=338584 RepID=UPI001BB38FC1|nr:hypothetical protein [Polymorphospora rubra]